MSADLSVSLDRTGIVVEIATESLQYRSQQISGATLSPDEARDAASMLNEAADAFEQREYQFPSRQVGEPR